MHKFVAVVSVGMRSLAALPCTPRGAIYSVHALMSMTAASVQTRAIRASLNGNLQERDDRIAR